MLSTALKRAILQPLTTAPRTRSFRKLPASRFCSSKLPSLAHHFSTMAQRGSDYLVWVDLEMTGLNIDKDHIIEMAVIVTDKDLKVIAEVRCRTSPLFLVECLF